MLYSLKKGIFCTIRDNRRWIVTSVQPRATAAQSDLERDKALAEAEPEAQAHRHHVGERSDRPQHVELLQVGADGVGQQALRQRLLRHVPGESVIAEAEIEQDAAPQGRRGR